MSSAQARTLVLRCVRPTRLFFVRHENVLPRDVDELSESTSQDLVGQMAHVAEIPVGGTFARQLAAQVLTQNVRCRAGGLISLLMSPERGYEHYDRVLHAQRQLGHAALAVGELELVLTHRRAQIGRMSLAQGQGE